MLACPSFLTHRAHAHGHLATTGHPRPAQAEPPYLSGPERTGPDATSRHFGELTSLVGGRSGDSAPPRPPNRGTDPTPDNLSRAAAHGWRECPRCGRIVDTEGELCAACSPAIDLARRPLAELHQGAGHAPAGARPTFIKMPRRGCHRPGRDTTREALVMPAHRTRARGAPASPLDMLAIAQRVAETTTLPIESPPTVPATTVDARGYRRASTTLPGAGRGRTPGNKGQSYPPTPPTTEEVARMLQRCGHGPDLEELRRVLAEHPARLPAQLRDQVCGLRMRALIVLLWRSGLRVSEALALTEQDLDEVHHTIVVRSGKGGKRRLSGMDDWGWQHLQPWIAARRLFPAGPLFCVVDGPTAGRRTWAANSVRAAIAALAADVDIRHRVAPHQLRHAHATELAREGTPLHLVSRQLGHANLAITTQYLRAIAPEEVIDAVAARRPPMIGIGGPR